MRTFFNEKIRTNPLGLNVIIVLLVLSAGGSLVGIFISPLPTHFLINVCFSGLLAYGLLQRAEWARAIIGVLSGVSLLIMAPPFIIQTVRNPEFSMERLFTFAITGVYLGTFIYLWRPKIRRLFRGGAEPASVKRIVMQDVLPTVLVLAIFIGGAFSSFKRRSAVPTLVH
jgi:hypothetical protein